MELEFLYRGFDCRKTLEQTMTPKLPADSPEGGAEFGSDQVECGDSDFTFGINTPNTIHSHEKNGNGDPTPGISTTSKFEVAYKYALGKNGNLQGRVIKFSISALKNANVEIHRINDVLDNPSIPDDDEHWIFFEGRFPMGAIVEIVEVCA